MLDEDEIRRQEDAEYEIYLSIRESIETIRRDNAQSYNSTIRLLSGAFLVLSAAFIKDVGLVDTIHKIVFSSLSLYS